MTKLRIDFNTGILEVEGEETFVNLIYQDYKAKLGFAHITPSTVKNTDSQDVISLSKEIVKSGSKKSSKSKNKESYAIVKDLNLAAKDNKQSLRDFYKEKLNGTATAMENNAVFVYYLQKIADTNFITLNHIYSCYKDTSTRVPTALRQSLLDTSHRKGWVDTSSFDNLVITTAGENFVEQDLPNLSIKPEK